MFFFWGDILTVFDICCLLSTLFLMFLLLPFAAHTPSFLHCAVSCWSGSNEICVLHIAATDEGASADGQPSLRLGGRRAGPQGRADGPGATPA